ncbi:hypothetical protein [Deinococcus radiodurans]|jgi:hypothetical protein|uniref:Uncharacterized protein n=1 Tax=Deinococcus radiodurans (strain ATCC 13939 / DSM 20539 / JCM 16871 / CCUG 27074 / LMG 4051 / NBRC 15346 / NCIMB 9279 / VKM B-1422 / R1) TaxID=243230 RepID=Q9RZ36_DEIRA|nr:hypothetical protein [Deinococcus radiodurans]AAF12320.1 hypothetical protein DR_A0118 [Deinococcus radiodurans R1 = ATCC 13939 = DSM 20539]QEM72932.1 hypothetical protein DXG80_14050 [Deinococcus radiodurans]QIP33260.1 hypothetical protein HAV35_13885 [Deinococcus radiodurans]UDL01894.1 hypothetical protein E5E91_14280 [Deinococcus radiodurans R1 = ATCC 13939 = DSM 20539]UID71707.1 hypothetical protein DRO_A0118 [Deinococcus radiodurans R1 = ATCC 13939 = DSM 20539]
MIRLLMMLVVLSGVAQAQDLDLSGVNVQWLLSLANDPVTLGVLIFGLVSTVKRDFERRVPPVVWNPWLWRGLALGAGLVVSVLLHLVTGQAALALAGWPGVLVFGLVAGMAAIFGRDGLKTVLSWMAGVRSPTTVVTAPAVVLPTPASPDAPLPAPPPLRPAPEPINPRATVIVERGDDQVVLDTGH